MPNQKIFLDTEFIDNGKTIDLISIALVKQDGESLYLISSEFDINKCDKWLLDNVITNLGDKLRYTRKEIKEKIIEFIGKERTEFWAYYASYDWVVFCQLFGRMLDLPENYSYWVRDFKQTLEFFDWPMKKPKKEHNALSDALALRDTYLELASSYGEF